MSLQMPDLELERITDPADISICVHGTNLQAYELIKSSGGLSRMARTHIHFASGLPGDDGVISGMRFSASVIIYIDTARAMDAGYEFFRSTNGVILCAGAPGTGVLPFEFVSRVEQRNSRSGQRTVLYECEVSAASSSSSVAAAPASSSSGKPRFMRPQ